MTAAQRWSVASLIAAGLLAPISDARAQTAQEAACRSAISKNLEKFVSIVFKDLTKCHEQRDAGHLPPATNCNDVFSTPGGKSVAAYESAATAMRSACPDELTGVLAQFARCPSPHSNLDDDGASSGIDDFHEATSCVLNLAATLANGASATVLGASRATPTTAAAKCHRALGKALRQHVKAIAKVRHGCQSSADKSGGGLQYSCATFDDGKIADSLAKLTASIQGDCNVQQDDLVPLGACGQTPDQLVDCVGHIATVLGGGLVAEGYELPSTCKLGHASLTIHAGYGEEQTSTKFDVGYNGLGHRVDLLDGFQGAVNLACNDDCVECAITIAPVKDLPNSFCRCDADPTIHCDTVNGPDADDCGGGGCTCMFAPPLALSAAGTPNCVVNKLVAELDGVADGGTGVSTTTVFNRSVVYTGNSQTQPCPLCVDDPAPNDGVRGGTCAGGKRNALACDQNGDSPDFGPVSYECLPLTGQNISGSGLKLRFDVTSVRAPMIGADLTQNGIPVFCLQCSGDSTVGCSSDADCSALGAGTCSVSTGPQARRNGCDDGLCTSASSTETGVCEGNVPDQFCDGLIRRQGGGMLPCQNADDCRALDSECPGGNCGSCTVAQQRSCFPDPFGAVGSDGAVGSTASSGAYGADLVSTMCIAATGNSGVNASVGLPGPGRLLLNFDFLGRCASDNSVAFELPGGSNCP